MTTIIDSEKIIDTYINRLSRKWEVTLRTPNGIQVKQIKRMNRSGFWVGLVLLPFWGIGFILWILVLIDYALQREKLLFITVDQMIDKLKGDK